MSDLDELYQETLLDRSRDCSLRGFPCTPCAKVEAFNPLCGDEVVFCVGKFEGKVSALGYECKGCAISQAAASMAAESIQGKAVGEALEELSSAMTYVTSCGKSPIPSLQDWAALGGVGKFPLRVKCATMAIRAAMAALSSDDGVDVELED